MANKRARRPRKTISLEALASALERFETATAVAAYFEVSVSVIYVLANRYNLALPRARATALRDPNLQRERMLRAVACYRANNSFEEVGRIIGVGRQQAQNILMSAVAAGFIAVEEIRPLRKKAITADDIIEAASTSTTFGKLCERLDMDRASLDARLREEWLQAAVREQIAENRGVAQRVRINTEYDEFAASLGRPPTTTDLQFSKKALYERIRRSYGNVAQFYQARGITPPPKGRRPRQT